MTTSSATIFDGVLEYSISIYTEEGETREGLLKKFDGDKMKLVQWLRERAFDKDTPVKDVKIKSAEPKKEIPEPKKKRASKKKDSEKEDKSQNSIF